MRGLALLLALGLALTGPAWAQDPEPQVGIVVVDADRLFTQSLFGKRVAEETRLATIELAQENRRLEADLTAEEQSLTERRADMEVGAFRAEAEAFDSKVQAIRRAQDAKERALQQGLTEGRDDFADAARPVLGKIMTERGAQVILDRRSVFLWSSRVDITDAAIRAVDAAIGDGTDLAAPDTAPAAQAAPDAETEEAPEVGSEGAADPQ